MGHMECEITSVKHLPKDSNIGYADLYRTPRDMVAAVVPVGHIDGFGLTKANDLCRPVDKLRHLVHAVKDFSAILKFTVISTASVSRSRAESG